MAPKIIAALIALIALAALAPACSEDTLTWCGQDVSGLRSTLFALDASNGELLWETETPLVDPWVTERDGVLRVSRADQGGDLYFDPVTGERVGEDQTRHTVVIHTVSAGENHAGDVVVDGETLPGVVTIGGTTIMRRLGGELVGVDTTTGADVWRHALPRPAGGRPTVVGDHVVAVVTDSRPMCP